MLRCMMGVMVIAMLSRGVQADDWKEKLDPRKFWGEIKGGAKVAYEDARDYCQGKVENARTAQARRWGIVLPEKYDPSKPLVLLIHGLDSDQGVWYGMATLMKGQGMQVGYFVYPSDGSVAASIEMLNDRMAEFHKAHGGAKVDIVAHSMGALVARGYIEGDRYVHPVGRFIAVGPPNHGTQWVRARFALEIKEHYWLAKTHKDWNVFWMMTDGTGQASDDLKPGSPFLNQLNSRKRREGVGYTIISGSCHVGWRKTAEGVQWVHDKIPANWYGTRSVRDGLGSLEKSLRDKSGASDGAVSCDSAELEGVKDIVRVNADHGALVMTIDAAPPAAWDEIRKRLGP